MTIATHSSNEKSPDAVNSNPTAIEVYNAYAALSATTPDLPRLSEEAFNTLAAQVASVVDQGQESLAAHVAANFRRRVLGRIIP
jgi:hypothetical protein